ncbi:MAG: ABC transporter ATP-binding protein, partial [Caldisphaeraceae archaeon]|nr:ABC transporter ATP-binding protein [Caldisphaeraceae archaeon]
RLRNQEGLGELLEKVNEVIPGSSSISQGQLVIKVGSSSEVLPSLVKVLSRYDVVEIKIVKPNLEEVFIELTGRELKEEGGFDKFKFVMNRRRMAR